MHLLTIKQVVRFLSLFQLTKEHETATLLCIFNLESLSYMEVSQANRMWQTRYEMLNNYTNV